MTIEVSGRTSKPFKRWWRLKIRLKWARWFRTELEAESQSFESSSALADEPAKKALPPP